MRPGPRIFPLLLTVLCGCPQPVPGQCVPAPGHLCITAQAPGTAASAYAIEVRVGQACDGLDQPPASVAAIPGECQDPVPACKRSLRSGSAGELPRLQETGELSADIDLGGPAGSTGPVTVLVTLLDARGECLAHDRQAVPAGAAEIALAPRDCQAWHRPCQEHASCGGPGAAQLCCRGRCVDPPPGPPGTAFIPAGELVFGDATPGAVQEFRPCEMDGAPRRSRITAPFFIDIREASVLEYQRCRQAQQCPAPIPQGPMNNCVYRDDPSTQDLAMNCLSAAQAQAYCRYRTGQEDSLPWEIEWEWVAGRGQGRYPWALGEGGQVTCADANAQYTVCGRTQQPQVVAPGSFAGDRTPGAAPWPQPPLLDLGGNVAEWVADYDGLQEWFDRCLLPVADPVRRPPGAARIYRGGGWRTAADFLRSTARRKLSADEGKQLAALPFIDEVGVRCVWRLPR